MKQAANAFPAPTASTKWLTSKTASKCMLSSLSNNHAPSLPAVTQIWLISYLRVSQSAVQHLFVRKMIEQNLSVNEGRYFRTDLLLLLFPWGGKHSIDLLS